MNRIYFTNLKLLIIIILSTVLNLCAFCLFAQTKAVFIIVDGIPADLLEKTVTPVICEISS
ncbi:MAG TPA: hypothetical protein VIH57_18765, partial [Bacteroidales bacterium]